MTPFATRAISACTAITLALAPVAAAAKSASSLNDLVGARAAGAESDMEARGWVLTDGHKGQNAAYTYWWNSSRKDCVMVTTRDGRYAAISDVTPGDCNQKSGGGSNAGAVAGAVAAGAVLAAIIASSSHKSGNHDNGQHYSDSQKEADYEAGYRDGLHNSPYRPSGDKDSYSQGYNNGVEQRDRELADSRNARTGSGYGGGGGYEDLVGAKAAGAESDLEARGFRNVDSFRSGNGSGTIWWNGRTRQCLQMITVNGRADSITDIQTHPNCRDGGGSRGGYGGGGASPAQYEDLVGAKAAGAESDLEARGFRNVDGFDAGNGKGTIWWNSRTQQCLQMITADGRADSITDIQTHNACR